MENIENNNRPTVEKVLGFIDKFTEGGEIVITKERRDENGNVVELEVRLKELDSEGNVIQFDYLVNKAGRMTLDKVVFDEDGMPLGEQQIAEYINGSWQNV